MGRNDSSTEALLENLTEPQRAAVTHAEGPLLVLAGPGSGKTRVITRRAAYLAKTVASAHQILAITFTNKAAREMGERIESLDVGAGMTVATFHAFCARLLRIHHDRAGIARNFTILDRDDRRKVVKEAIELCDLSPTNYPPARMEQRIGQAKNDMQGPVAYAESAFGPNDETVSRIYTAYEELLTEYQSLDFDDLLMRVADLLQKDEELRTQLEAKYRFILIDEYQDTNRAQYLIAHLLARDHHNICATGDPDQSIYAWRGADIRNILSFETDHPNAKVVRLEQNYRSTGHILAAADGLIAENIGRKEKALWTENEDGAPVRILECESGTDEARLIAEDIVAQQSAGLGLDEIAVFYRVNALSRALEEALRAAGIRYQIARGVEFYGRKEIKDVLAYLRLMVNPADRVSLLRVINTPARGIGATTVRRMIAHAESSGERLFDVVTDERDLSFLGRSASKVRAFGAAMRDIAPAMEMSPRPALEHVIDHSGLRAMYNKASVGDEDPAANLNELISAAADHQSRFPDATIVDWLEQTALLSDVDALREGEGAVTLMTLHAAKGLEFPVVYMVGLEEGLLPFFRSDEERPDSGHIEEERRLCFVGMTRAMKKLTMSSARYRMLRGQTKRTVRSPFLVSLPDHCVERDSQCAVGAHSGPGPIEGKLPHDIEEWGIGTLVRHPTNGLGQVLHLGKISGRPKADVKFENGHRGVYMLEFAELQRVDFDEVGD